MAISAGGSSGATAGRQYHGYRSGKRGGSARRKTPPRPTPRKRYNPPPPTYNPPPRRSSYNPPSSPPRSSPGPSRSVGRAPVAPKPKPKPKPKPPNIRKYLAGDVTYQDLLRGQQRTWGDFAADINRQRGEARTSFQDVTRNMNTERERALEALQNEFAARGLLQSGLFGEATGDYNQDWQSQMTQLQQGQKSLMSDFLSQRTNFRREQSLAKEAARQDAIKRRASKYGL